jgi:hypothetical protein
MLTKTDGKNAKAHAPMALASAEHDGNTRVSRLTSEQVWDEVAKASFAVLSYVTPSGEPRSSGVVYKTVGRRWYAAVSPKGWKARHVAASSRVSVTVPVHRGGVLSLLVPIPPATVSFHGSAIVHPAGSPDARTFIRELAPLLPADRQAAASIIEVVPEGAFVTYGVGVPLMKMRDPGAASARVPVASR